MKIGLSSIKFIIILICYFSIVPVAFAEEITFFDKSGTPCAYVDIEDEQTIYLWGGEPVAYLEDDSIYGFNGKHLGWFTQGIIWDHEGYAVGFIEGTIQMFTKFEPYKSYKRFKPFKSFKEFSPFKPFFTDRWSRNSLIITLKLGSK
jgi:hypothetical protein